MLVWSFCVSGRGPSSHNSLWKYVSRPSSVWHHWGYCRVCSLASLSLKLRNISPSYRMHNGWLGHARVSWHSMSTYIQAAPNVVTSVWLGSVDYSVNPSWLKWGLDAPWDHWALVLEPGGSLCPWTLLAWCLLWHSIMPCLDDRCSFRSILISCRYVLNVSDGLKHQYTPLLK